MNRIEVNVATGETTEVPLTPEEVAALPAPADWRPQAIADLNVFRARRLGVLSSMLSVYQAKGETANVSAVVAAMEAVTVIESEAGAVRDVYLAPTSTRAEFEAAVNVRWAAIVSPAPAQVKADFSKYGGNTV